MASIGPQIPTHLLKQKKIDGDDPVTSEEVVLETEASANVSLGPQVSTDSANPAAPSSAASDDDNDEDYGPALPPNLIVKRSGTSATAAKDGTSVCSASPSGPSRRVLGPSFPGRDQHSCYDDDDTDDDDYGPRPLPEGAQKTDGVSEGVREFLEKEERRRKDIEEAAKPKKPEREEWMLVPPSSSDLLGHLGDPTKLKARQFSRGSSTASRSAPNNLWTETPAERQQRIADEVAGKRRRAANADDDSTDSPEEDRRKRKKDLELRKVVEEHTKSSRGKSLIEIHEGKQSKGKKGKSDKDEPEAIWDHARDMSLGGRLMDEKQRAKMLSDARSLGDRFGSGKGGSYL